jgi:hypothetical protein
MTEGSLGFPVRIAVVRKMTNTREPSEVAQRQVGFEVFTAVSMKMAVFWVASIIRAMSHRPDDGGSKDL